MAAVVEGREGSGLTPSEGDNLSLTESIISIDSASVKGMTTEQVSSAELGETEEIRSASLEKFRLAVKSDPQLRSCVSNDGGLTLDSLEDEQARRFLLRFLRSNKFNVLKALEQLKGYLRMKQAEPTWYTGLGDVDNLGNALELLGNGHYFATREKDSMGRRVIVNMASRFDVGRHTYLDQMRAISITLETLLAIDDDAQVRGVTHLIDCTGLSLRHGLIWSPLDAAKLLNSGQKFFPVRHRAMVVVNTPFGMGAALDFAKKFMTASNKKKIQVVRGGSKSLPSHSNGLLKDILPKELGGPDGASTAEEMAKDWKETVIQNSHKLKCLDYLKLQEDGT